MYGKKGEGGIGRDIALGHRVLLDLLQKSYGPNSLLLGKESWSDKDPLILSKRVSPKKEVYRFSKAGKLLALKRNIFLKRYKKLRAQGG